MQESGDRNILNPRGKSANELAESKDKKLIKGLHDFEDLEHVTPEQLWIDGGIPFPKVLLVKFKKFTDTCGLIKEMERE